MPIIRVIRSALGARSLSLLVECKGAPGVEILSNERLLVGSTPSEHRRLAIYGELLAARFDSEEALLAHTAARGLSILPYGGLSSPPPPGLPCLGLDEAGRPILAFPCGRLNVLRISLGSTNNS